MIDTNVLVSAYFFKKSIPRQAFDLAMKIGQITYSDATLDELWEVLVRPKFDRFLSLAERIDLLRGFEAISLQVTVHQEMQLCRDPKDDKFLSLAHAANANCIVSGDQDLLVLSPIFSVPIMSPADFLVKFEEMGRSS